MSDLRKKDKKFIEYYLIVFMTVISCWNKQLFLYGGFVVFVGLAVHNLLFNGELSKLYIPRASLFIYLFGVYCALSITWAWVPELALNRFKFITVAMIFLFLLINYFCKTKRVEYILYAIVVMGCVMSAYVIYTYGGLKAFYDASLIEESRLGGEITNVNTVGMNSAYSIVILFLFALFYKKKWCYLFMILPLLVVASSASKKAIIIVIVGMLLIIYFYQSGNKGVTKYFKILFSIAIFILLMKFLLSLDIMQNLNDRLEGFFNLFGSEGQKADGSTIARRNMMRSGFRQFLKTPVLGIGLANSFELNRIEINYFTYLHSDYIEMLVNGGLVGFCMYYGAIISLLIKHIKILRVKKDPIVVGSFTLIVIYLFLSVASVTYYYSLFTYMLMALWVCVVEINKDKYKESNTKNLG